MKPERKYNWDFTDVNPVAGDVIRFEAEERSRQGWRTIIKRYIRNGLVVRANTAARAIEVISSGSNEILTVPTTHVVAIKRKVTE